MTITNNYFIICLANSITQTFDKFGFLYSSVVEESNFLGSDGGSFEEWSRRFKGMCSSHFEVSRGPRLIRL